MPAERALLLTALSRMTLSRCHSYLLMNIDLRLIVFVACFMQSINESFFLSVIEYFAIVCNDAPPSSLLGVVSAVTF